MKGETDVTVLLEAEFSTPASSWTEYLCIEVRDGAVILSSRGYEVLGEASDYEVESEDGETEYEIPDVIDGQTVGGIEDGLIIGSELVPQDDEAQILLKPGQIEAAQEWLELREWHRQKGFEEAWEKIREALAGPSA